MKIYPFINLFYVVGICALFLSCSGKKDENSEKDTLSEGFDNCDDGWCKINHGSFTYGSLASSAFHLCRSAYAENQVQVTLTNNFIISQTEVTQKQWEAVGFPNPSREPAISPNKPITWINWFEALAYANALSEKEGLEKCYDLSRCEGEVGSGCPPIGEEVPGGGSRRNEFGCIYDFEAGDYIFVPDLYICKSENDEGDYHNPKYKDNWYKCPGYRLPTSAEWEYAARAGTTTSTYNGNVTKERYDELDPVLEPIAWYSYNSGAVNLEDASWTPNMTKQVGLKKPNDWGLYDVIGNVDELIDYHHFGRSLETTLGLDGPLTDPLGAYFDEKDVEEDGDPPSTDVAARGETITGSPCYSTVSWPGGTGRETRSNATGFRLVRTLFE